ncbi:MAG: pyridoxamine 5'-phosphate oxidase [Bacteroidetes bacterium]|nr:pyridoxamine 5'-phosphate oxidase [Bacteroidota bacterium]MBT5531038.1 pyridoxamine 5'-phosphate oxidase [Cytophagia bacterium]MBT6836288.1 pyridoxamine 5'-phosphate oxidase [Bacteroidota bacterium]MBT7827057.1 pyridoxamine 5'-phosphate oxidase [Bacteroidota bacterium]MBT7994767.1 pyridoxamine 5'-phosphate oxidase [Bacteroidota bacterium]
MNEDHTNSRREFKSGSLSDQHILQDPLAMFAAWMNEAANKQILEANAMTLSTVNDKGEPSSRVVLLRGIDERGFTFYTNYNSQKSKQIGHNNKVALNFFWPLLERQVRINGIINKISDSEADAYFASRPRESQIGAWASPQSEVIESKRALIEKFADIESKAANGQIPRPKFWGGLIVVPHYYEFWQGGEHRLHDRYQYELQIDKKWKISRLAP